MPTLPRIYLDAYHFGKRMQGQSLTDIAYGDGEREFNYYMSDHALATFFEMGYQGQSLPPYVTGWRYGEIPEAGRSINFRDQKWERGVSLMALDGEEPTEAAKLYAVFNAAGKPKIRVGGWYVGRGADGEPLVLLAHKISNAE